MPSDMLGRALTKTFLHSPLVLFEPSAIPLCPIWSFENKFDYGIAAGLGMELALPRVGHFLLEGRYYYGLGNIYGDSKRDYFARSNHSKILMRTAVLTKTIFAFLMLNTMS